ncbi:uncharacterized protein LOC108846445 isoform X4 [Raphanus sativus]|nr:uncharacterized protein LOC108846445 isoform X4 [Raphanus sativus]
MDTVLLKVSSSVILMPLPLDSGSSLLTNLGGVDQVDLILRVKAHKAETEAHTRWTGENLENHVDVKNVLVDMGIYFQVQVAEFSCYVFHECYLMSGSNSLSICVCTCRMTIWIVIVLVLLFVLVLCQSFFFHKY